MNNKAHQYKVWDGIRWVRNLGSGEHTEAIRKGLLEHDENCWCNVVDDNPPF